MVVNREISSDIFDKADILEKERKDIHLNKLKGILETLERLDLNIVNTNTGQVIDMSNISLEK